MLKSILLVYCLMFASATVLVSCSDDDDNSNTNTEEVDGTLSDHSDESATNDSTDEGDTNFNSSDSGDASITEQEQDLLVQQIAIKTILKTLANVDSIPPRFDQEHYEPTYGTILDESQPYVRSVPSSDVEDAEARFRSLVGNDNLLTTTGDGLSVSLEDMPLMTDGTRLTLGTLTFHRGDGQRETGYVEVRIPCMPHLIRIDYLLPSAFPDNANSPYQVGDIIWVPSGTYVEGYYLCVRASNSSAGLLVHLCVGEKDGKETHNLDNDGDGCFYPMNKDKGQVTTAEDVRDYVNFFLEEKEKAASIRLFFANKCLTKKPSHQGCTDHIVPGGFNTERNYAYCSDQGATIWIDAEFGSYAWVPAYHYRIAHFVWVPNYCKSLDEVNEHTWTYVKDGTWNDWYNDWKYYYTMNVIKFRSAISGARLDFSPISDAHQFANDAHLATQQNVGWIYAKNNRLYPNVEQALAAGTSSLGIVAYVNDGSEFGDKATEMESGYGHGLVISQLNANNNQMRWNNTSDYLVEIDPYSGYGQFIPINSNGGAAVLTDFDGLMKTFTMRMTGSEAAETAMSYMQDDNEFNSILHSKWFLPSTAQWVAILCKPGLGGADKPAADGPFPTFFERNESRTYDRINDTMLKPGNWWTYSFLKRQFSYWSSSSMNGKFGIYLKFNEDKYGEAGVKLSTWRNATTKALVRPVFAF